MSYLLAIIKSPDYNAVHDPITGHRPAQPGFHLGNRQRQRAAGQRSGHGKPLENSPSWLRPARKSRSEPPQTPKGLKRVTLPV